ncbi:MAG: glycosyltransferase family 4 protein [Monoglobaceae bacterium]
MGKKALVVSALSGFITTFLQHDIKLLQEMGYEVHCAGNASNKNPEENKAAFDRINTPFHQIDFSSKSPLSKDNLIAFRQIRKLIKEAHFDVIHCHTPIPGVVVRLAAAGSRLAKKTKVIYTTHGFYFHKKSSKKSWCIFYTIEKIMSAFSDAIITINWEDYNNAKKMFCKKVYHINGVGLDTDKYTKPLENRDEYRKSLGISKEDLMILAIGELSERKNHKIVIEALGQDKIKNAVFVVCGKAIAGNGTYEQLTELAKENNVRVIFLGHRMDIPEICHCADIGVMPSTREGLGMAGLEMLAAGVPLVASNVHGINDYVCDGVNGFSVSPNDAAGFAEAIFKLSNPDTRENMRAACVEKSKEFDQKISFAQMKKIYNEILMN